MLITVSAEWQRAKIERLNPSTWAEEEASWFDTNHKGWKGINIVLIWCLVISMQISTLKFFNIFLLNVVINPSLKIVCMLMTMQSFCAILLIPDQIFTVVYLQSPISPQSDRDVLGKTFKELQQFILDNANKSLREVEHMKKSSNQVHLSASTISSIVFML